MLNHTLWDKKKPLGEQKLHGGTVLVIIILPSLV